MECVLARELVLGLMVRSITEIGIKTSVMEGAHMKRLLTALSMKANGLTTTSTEVANKLREMGLQSKGPGR